MNEVLNVIKTRRAIRHFQSKQVADEELKIIIEAGLYAPSAGGMQRPLLMVCQDQQKIYT